MSDPMYRAAVEAAPEEDRNKIINGIEPVVLELLQAFDALREEIERSPELLAEFRRATNSSVQVVNAPPAGSGSLG